MIQQVSPKEVYLKITNACEQLQTQYEQWISYGQNDSTGLQYAPMFAFLILPFYQAVVTCKDLERLYPQQLEQISGLIQLMDEIIQSLHDNTQKFYTYGAGLGTGTQMAAQLTFAMTKVEELKIKALSLQLLPSEVQQFKHLRCAQNHWLQFEDVNEFICSRQGCGTTYRSLENQVRACMQCNYYVCDNCINHQQI